MYDVVMFPAKAKACWYFHLQITRPWLWDYISNAVSHRVSSLTCNFFFPRKILLKDTTNVTILSRNKCVKQCSWTSDEREKDLQNTTRGRDTDLRQEKKIEQKSVLKLTRSNKRIASETRAFLSKECDGKLFFSQTLLYTVVDKQQGFFQMATIIYTAKLENYLG